MAMNDKISKNEFNETDVLVEETVNTKKKTLPDLGVHRAVEDIIDNADLRRLHHHLRNLIQNAESASRLKKNGSWNEEIKTMLQENFENHIKEVQIHIMNLKKVAPVRADLLRDFFETAKDVITKNFDPTSLEILSQKNKVCEKEVFDREKQEASAAEFRKEIMSRSPFDQPFSPN